MMHRHRRRHLHDRGGGLARWLADACRPLLDNHTWRRHPAPFSKTQRGLARREARLHVIADKRSMIHAH